ncbi:hypothetical protein CRUP_024564 [Coryphaenoides rupestris]|nr:hypothetical protein CRUP_024564 [Coryphaenoides rupestris]
MDFVRTKSRELINRRKVAEDQISSRNMNPRFSHQALMEMFEEITNLRQEIIPLTKKLEPYLDLSPGCGAWTLYAAGHLRPPDSSLYTPLTSDLPTARRPESSVLLIDRFGGGGGGGRRRRGEKEEGEGGGGGREGGGGRRREEWREEKEEEEEEEEVGGGRGREKGEEEEEEVSSWVPQQVTNG